MITHHPFRQFNPLAYTSFEENIIYIIIKRYPAYILAVSFGSIYM